MRHETRIALAVCFYIIVFLGGVHKATSQDKGRDRFAVVKFSPLVMFEPQGGYQLGLELPLAANFSLQAEYAHLPFSSQGANIVFFKSSPGFYASAYKAEARLYVLDRNMISPGDKKFSGKDIQGLYIAGQAQLKKAISVERGFIEDSVQLGKTVYYSQQRDIFKANFKLGYQVILDYGFVIDSYAGVGYRHVTVKNNPQYDNDIIDEPLFLYFPINIALGIKVGLAF